MITTKGQCAQCKEIVTKRSAVKHIESCYFALSKKINDCFLVKIFDQSNIFWMYLAVSLHNCTLGDLDNFLRTIWLECCGHMSEFDIEKKSMNNTIGKVFHPGFTCSYEYDFGTTTYLYVEVIGLYRCDVPKKIKLLMRNEMPAAVCNVCRKDNPRYVCAECQWVMCTKKCAKKHNNECDEVSLLPFVNSPRTGECGYEGPAKIKNMEM